MSPRELVGHAARLGLKAVFAVARPVSAFDAAALIRVGRTLRALATAAAEAFARAHRGSPQDFALLYLAGLALLLVGRLFGS